MAVTIHVLMALCAVAAVFNPQMPAAFRRERDNYIAEKPAIFHRERENSGAKGPVVPSSKEHWALRRSIFVDSMRKES
ncbi:MAG: hypothetical protein AAFP78_02510 [Pseudomonadota bacterium]